MFDIFEPHNHIRSDFEKSRFNTISSWDFGWEILETINLADSANDENELSKRFSPGQKALYFFWYLDAQVTNGGFIQFYYNDYRIYLQAIKNGLKLIGDDQLFELVEMADSEYLLNKTYFDQQVAVGIISPLYQNLSKFPEFDEAYLKIHDNTMNLIENYARLNSAEFVNLI